MLSPQLDTFILVAETGSFTKAAQRLFMSTSTAIKQVNQLEARLGVRLFDRSHQGLTLTRAGEGFLVDARAMKRYADEAVERARTTQAGGRHVVRIGLSPMTPNSRVAQLLPGILERCPNLSVQVVPFENTPVNAREILASLGEEIDVVAGVYDRALLQERRCDALELSREELRCAVPIADAHLSILPVVTLDDLHGHSLMVIRRGWNRDIDALRDEILARHPQVQVVDFPQFRLDAFNRAAGEGRAIVSLDMWRDVQPMLRTLPTDWGLSVSYGIMHAPHPSGQVREFLDALTSLRGESASDDPGNPGDPGAPGDSGR